MPTTSQCPPCQSRCCCCQTCGRCMPEWLYLKILTVTGPGSTNWAWAVNAIAAFHQSRADAPVCSTHPCNDYIFQGMITSGTLIAPDCVEYSEDPLHTDVICQANSFTLSRVYLGFTDATTPNNPCDFPNYLCPCDPVGDAVGGIDNNGEQIGTADCNASTCYGVVFDEYGEEVAGSVRGLIFTLTFGLTSACRCSKFEADAGVDRCDAGVDSPKAFLRLGSGDCNDYNNACGYNVSRNAESCTFPDPETELCPTTPPSQTHTLVWGNVVCGEEGDNGGFVSQTFTATFAEGSSCCDDDVVVTGILYA